MPLTKSKSKKAFSHNVGAEMSEGKPQKQALAIAYAVKRKARKMSNGGMVEQKDQNPNDDFLTEMDGDDSPFQTEVPMGDGDADGAAEDEGQMDNTTGNSLLDSIMKKMRMKRTTSRD